MNKLRQMDKLNIKYLKHSQINFRQWDDAINKSYNSYVYALSSYLNIVTGGKWDALVTDKYEYVMPLPVKKKFFLKVSLHPLFSQQLGVFSSHKITPEIVKQFISAIPKNIKYLELKFNKYNDLSLVDFAETKENTNYELDLILPYDKLMANFSTNTKRNIKKALSNGLEAGLIDSKTFFNFFKYYFGRQFRGVLSKKDFATFSKLTDYTSYAQNFKNFFLGVGNEKKQLIAAAYFVSYKGKIYYIDGVSSPEGKEKSAMFLLFNYLIEKYSNSNIILDFEGSNIDSVARFYKGFGAMKTTYNTLIINKIGFLSKLKK